MAAVMPILYALSQVIVILLFSTYVSNKVLVERSIAAW